MRHGIGYGALGLGGLAYLLSEVYTIQANLYSASLLWTPTLLLLIPYWYVGHGLLAPSPSFWRKIAFVGVCISMIGVLYFDVTSYPLSNVPNLVRGRH